MNIFHFDDYREAIREQTKFFRLHQKGFNLKRLSGMVPIQYTYLSKALNDPKTHLSEDHLFRICQILKVGSEETDFLSLLRSHAVTQDSKRKNFLAEKIVHLRREKGGLAEMQASRSIEHAQQMDYLLDPLCILVHVSLLVPNLRENPRAFCNTIGISAEKYRETLKKLSDTGFVELAEGKEQVVRILKSKIHYPPTHPFMRAHQNQVRMLAQAKLLEIPEEHKTSVMLTFSGDEATRKKIVDKLTALLKEVQQDVTDAKDEHVYQVCLDLFRWT